MMHDERDNLATGASLLAISRAARKRLMLKATVRERLAGVSRDSCFRVEGAAPCSI